MGSGRSNPMLFWAPPPASGQHGFLALWGKISKKIKNKKRSQTTAKSPPTKTLAPIPSKEKKKNTEKTLYSLQTGAFLLIRQKLRFVGLIPVPVRKGPVTCWL